MHIKLTHFIFQGVIGFYEVHTVEQKKHRRLNGLHLTNFKRSVFEMRNTIWNKKRNEQTNWHTFAEGTSMRFSIWKDTKDTKPICLTLELADTRKHIQ